jgi:integrase
VYIGPQAQAILTPVIGERKRGNVFDPRRAWQEESDARRAKAKRVRPAESLVGPPATVGSCYTTASYNRAIRRGAKAANVGHWSVNQLRHSAGTNLRAEHGLEAAQRMLGHLHASTTERYAKAGNAAAVEAAKKSG